jgi:RHS repeat-associated protein
MKNIHSDENIIKGKVGKTTDTYYPNAGTGTAPIDGRVSESGSVNYTFSDLRNASGNEVTNTGVNNGVGLDPGLSTDTFNTHRRSIVGFNTSAINDTDTIDSATFSSYHVFKSTDQFGSTDMDLVSASPGSESELVAGDYAIANFGTTRLATGKDIDGLTLNTYSNFALNTNGVSHINKTGNTFFGVRLKWDTDGSFTGSWASGEGTKTSFSSADVTGTTQDPKLVVEHSVTAPTVPDAPTNLLVNGFTNPSNVATSSPYFSAIHQNASSTALATSYQIQIATSSSFANTYWDSGKTAISSSTPPNGRTPDLYATTTFPIDGTEYFWKIKFWDQYEGEGEWSSVLASFTMRAPATTLQDLRYTYDAVGNITNIVDASGGNGAGNYTYTYDDLYRLTSASSTDSISNWLETYSYDHLGNITNKSNVGDYTYAGTNYANPHAVTTAGTTNYTYDNAGNVTQAGNTYYSWDYANRLSDTSNNGTTTGYIYNHAGQRVQQDVKIGTNATSTTKYFNRYFETSGATTTLYIYLPNGELLGTIEGNGNATSTFIVHTDHLGGTNVISDKEGNQAQLTNYYPYGSIRQNETAGFDEKRKAIGQYYDDATVLNYYNARYMESNRGQFMSEDPVFWGDPNRQNLTNPQSLNSYSYANDNPITYSDPLGLFVMSTGLIQKGDTLGGITSQLNAKYGSSLTVSQVASANGIKNVNLIYTGNYITLPQTNLGATFNGSALQVVDKTYNNTPVQGLSWPAVSGNVQTGANKTPTGTWSAKPKDTQYFPDSSLLNNFASTYVSPVTSLFGKKYGSWPGGPAAWGTVRTELSNKDTGQKNTGYYIHGGDGMFARPGSAGCIDLMGGNYSFHEWFSGYGKNLDILVKY